MSTSTAKQMQYQRIEAYCKTIWGANKTFDITIESDDYYYYACYVREDQGLDFGPFLTATTTCKGQNAAWHELERMLHLWAKQKGSNRPMTQEERLNIFSGPRGEFRELLKTFLKHKEAHDAREARERDEASYLKAVKAIDKIIDDDVAGGGDRADLEELKKEVLAKFRLGSL